MIKVGVIIPDRNDRPDFLGNCLRMIAEQTLKPVIVELVNDKPITAQCDITWRYRLGYDRFQKHDVDVIAFMENDDWYSPEYLEVMANAWEKHGRPDIFGTNYTIYYHLKLKKWFTFKHHDRASAMNTLIKPYLSFKWCVDHEPFTDTYLWDILPGVTFKPEKHVAIGMKHGVGMLGGKLHVNRLHRYVENDNGFLKNNLDPKSYEFYSTLFK
jgi:glycosyltransferase involved in cell wall biosynthesis